MKSFSQYISEASYGHTLWIDPKGKVYDMGNVANNTHFQWVSNNWSKYFGRGKIDDKGNASDGGNVYDTPMQKGWARVRNHNSDISVQVDFRKLNRSQKKSLKDIVDGGGRRNLDRPMYVDNWKKNKTSRAGDKAFNDYEEISDFLSESIIDIPRKGQRIFKQYITEKPAKISASWPYKGAKWEDFRGLENPTERELVAMINKSKFYELRFIVDNKGKMWAWDSDEALHGAVIFGMTGQKDMNNHARGMIGFIDIDGEDDPSVITKSGNLRVIIHNSRSVGTDFALKNKTMKALAKRINAKGKDRVFWSDI
jgi:hypothetical protein